MNTKTSRWLFTLITALAAFAFVATSGIADTPSSTDEDNAGHMMQPGMPGGMGPGQMGYGKMGPGYMHKGGKSYGGMGYGMGMMQVLNLDKTQRSKLRALMREQRTANCKTMTQIMDVRDELAAEYDKDKPDAKVIGKLYEKMQGMQRHMLERSVEMHNKFREMLNKEQQATFDRMCHGGMGMMNMMQ